MSHGGLAPAIVCLPALPGSLSATLWGVPDAVAARLTRPPSRPSARNVPSCCDWALWVPSPPPPVPLDFSQIGLGRRLMLTTRSSCRRGTWGGCTGVRYPRQRRSWWMSGGEGDGALRQVPCVPAKPRRATRSVLTPAGPWFVVHGFAFHACPAFLPATRGPCAVLVRSLPSGAYLFPPSPSRIFASVVGGATAGILGLRGLYGALFYLFVMAATAVVVLAKAWGASRAYWHRPAAVLAGGGAFERPLLLSYLLFWALLYSAVHLY